MTAPTIAFKGVTHRYRGSNAGDDARLDNLALDVPELIVGPGPTAILGPNGSGKTTLLRLVATVAEAQTGSIHATRARPPAGTSTDAASRIAVLVVRTDAVRMRKTRYVSIGAAMTIS